MGYEASMSTTGPVFLRPAIEIRERADPATVQAKGGVVGGKEGKRKQGKEGGIPESLSGRECSSDCFATVTAIWD